MALDKAPLTVVLVTGANAGIGFHLVRALLECGKYRVAAIDVDGDNLGRLRDRYGDRFWYHVGDVTVERDVVAAVEGVIALWGKVDILVNNACVTAFQRFEERSLAEMHREFEINFFGYARMLQAVLPHMRLRHSGLVHNLGSGVGIVGFPSLAGYTAAKGAIEAFTRTLALEYRGQGIDFTVMHPPVTWTKSAAPLGVPRRLMEDPADVGLILFRKIRSRRAVITADLRTAAFLFFGRRFPQAVGWLFARIAGRL